jgi:oxygen-independent coproporphyrinogen III oxidase
MKSPLGIYIHLPFCESKCGYCNFASGVYPTSMILPYIKALHEEISSIHLICHEIGADSRLLDSMIVDTVYFGGGTPSLLPAHHIAEIMRLLKDNFLFGRDVEVTLEVNPGTVDPPKARAHRDAGVNRVSIGMQTFQNSVLGKIGRSHSVEDSIATFELYRQHGLNNISLDLILGLPGMSQREWEHNLCQVSTLNPDHISMYMLEIHENTYFGKVYGPQQTSENQNLESSALADLPDDETVESYYFQAVDSFEAGGWRQYEISNFARPGLESRHNSKYWKDLPFLGFGCGAYSYLDGKRWGNEKNVGLYTELIGKNRNAIVFRSVLDEIERQEEALFLGMRLTGGISLTAFEEKFGFDLRSRFDKTIDHLLGAGLIEISPDFLRLTRRGWMLSNEVFSEFMQ